MASKKAKKIVTKKVVAKSAPRSTRQPLTGWKRFLVALGLSLILVIPLTAVAQTVNRAVLGAATQAAGR